MIHDEGAYTPQGINLPFNASTALPGPYILPAYELAVKIVETNKVATMPVRGAGYPEGAFAMERAAGPDRRRTCARPRRGSAPQSGARRSNSVLDPFEDALGFLDHARQRRLPRLPADGIGRHRLCRLCRAPGARAGRRTLSRHRRRQRNERHGSWPLRVRHRSHRPFGPHLRLHRCNADGTGNQDRARPDLRRAIRCFPATTSPCMAGDTAIIPHGQGGFASRQTVTAGSAVHLAAVAVREKALAVAAHLLEASPDDLECATAASMSPVRREAASHCARSPRPCPGYPAMRCRADFEPGLESMQNFIPSALTYGMGCHAVEVGGRHRHLRQCESCATWWSTTAAASSIP